MVRESPTPKPTSTLRIADAQAHIVWPILLQITVFLALFFFDGIGVNGNIIAVAAFMILSAVKTYQILKALDNKLALVCALVASLPLLGLFVLIPVNIAAVHKLRAAGLKVGFLGVPNPQRQALRDALAREGGR